MIAFRADAVDRLLIGEKFSGISQVAPPQGVLDDVRGCAVVVQRARRRGVQVAHHGDEKRAFAHVGERSNEHVSRVALQPCATERRVQVRAIERFDAREWREEHGVRARRRRLQDDDHLGVRAISQQHAHAAAERKLATSAERDAHARVAVTRTERVPVHVLHRPPGERQQVVRGCALEARAGETAHEGVTRATPHGGSASNCAFRTRRVDDFWVMRRVQVGRVLHVVVVVVVVGGCAVGKAPRLVQSDRLAEDVLAKIERAMTRRSSDDRAVAAQSSRHLHGAALHADERRG